MTVLGTVFTDFYDASQARDIARGGGAALGEILTEINYLKSQIDGQAPGGGLSVTVANATPMTMSTVYFNAWNDPLSYTDDASVLARSRMDAVIRYFSALGYRVQRVRVGVTDFFEWIISW
jgi:hypothetical protein